jgi:hypothetical protein
MLFFPFLVLGESLFPHEIWIDDKLVIELEGLAEATKTETLGLKMEIDPVGSMTISSQEELIRIEIDQKGTVSLLSSSHYLYPSGNIGKKITGIGKLSLKSDLSLGKIELILDSEMKFDKYDLLILPLIWKGIKKAGRTVVKEKKSRKIIKR